MIGRPPDKMKKIIKPCKQCGELFESYISSNRKFCSLKCRSDYYTGENHPMKKEESELIRYTKKCRNCGIEFTSCDYKAIFFSRMFTCMA